MTSFQIIAGIISFTAISGYLNSRFLKLPQTIGLMVLSLAVSVSIVFLGKANLVDLLPIAGVVDQIDFSSILVHGLLSLLLFAGALHVNLGDLENVKWSVSSLATGGVVLATFVTGTLVWWFAGVIGMEVPYIYALMFGALISPTDPVAVLSILKGAGVSKKIYTRIGGESLFNDGTGVVVFLTLLGVATDATLPDTSEVITLLLQQVLGGLALGLLLGWTVYKLLCPIDDHKVEILLTIGLAVGGYEIADLLKVSAPIFVVTAGLVVGNQGRNFGMSAKTRDRLDIFWELVDDILNAVLFILIGLEIIVIQFNWPYVTLSLAAIVAVLIGRFISVGMFLSLLGLCFPIERGTTALMTWGGLRGGLSIAMALSLPLSAHKNLMLTMTYIVVLFSIFVQGLTFKKVIALQGNAIKQEPV